MTNYAGQFFVSLTGDDRWSGRLPEPNSARSDGPFRTLEAAQEAVRWCKAALKAPAEICVQIRGGHYELKQTWAFAQADSGCPRASVDLAQTWPVVWAAYPGETPVLSGGRRISGPWHKETVNGCEAWVTEVPETHAGGWFFRQLWVNGERRLRPRLPKQGTWTVERALDANYAGGHGETIRRGARRFGFRAGELRADWRNLTDVEIQFLGWWMSPRCWLTGVDEDERVAGLDRDTDVRLAWGENDGIDYFVENVFEVLTEPGEWYLDRAAGRLWYLPRPGEEIATAEVIAPRLNCLLRIEGAANLRFEGLTFAHNEWRQSANYAGAEQSSAEVPGAIALSRADSCVFRNCRVQHTGTYGVELLHDTIETELHHCTICDLGAGGIKIWHGCRRNVVADCEIADGGHVFASGCGVLIGKSGGNRVEHCHIHDFYYSGISAGWTWGYEESGSYGNLIEWNHIHDLGKGRLSDMGGIYLLGHAPGTRLRFNRIHDIQCRRYGGWCMYTDEGSSNVLIESNLCYNANCDPFHQHYGRNNLVHNNILAYGGETVLAYGKQEPHLGLIFESNILLSRDTPILRYLGPDRWTPAQTAFRRNLYWCEKGCVRFARGGNSSCHGSQPFPQGYAAEAPRFAALAPLPEVADTPTEADWARSKVVARFFTMSGADTPPDNRAELRFLRQGHTLHARGVFQRQARREALSGAIWNREHVELFLKPFPNAPGMVQLSLAADGEIATRWYFCNAPTTFGWQAKALELDKGARWMATLQIPLAPIAAAAGGVGSPAWSFIAGFTSLPVPCDLVGWQALGQDPEGIAADPLLIDPTNGDFRLRADSPALKLGFVPFDLSGVGPRREPVT